MNNGIRRAAVIGIGNMGSAIASRLLSQGVDTTVWNRTPEKCEPLRAAGASIAESPAAAILSADLIFFCLIDHVATLEILGEDACASAVSGRSLVQTATVTSLEAAAFEAWAGSHGGDSLLGVIQSYPQQVLAGETRIIYSGSRSVFLAYLPILKNFEEAPRFLSDSIGAAATLDKAGLSCFYSCLISFCHGAAMCRAGGVPFDIYAKAAITGLEEQLARVSDMLKSRTYDEDIGATINVYAASHAKNVQEAELLGIDPSLPRLVENVLASAISAGYGDAEIASTSEVFGNDSGQRN